MRSLTAFLGLLPLIGCGGPAFETETVQAGCDAVIRGYHRALLAGDMDAVKACLGAGQLAELENRDSDKAEAAFQKLVDTAPASLEKGDVTYYWKPEDIKRAKLPKSIDGSRGYAAAAYSGPNEDGDAVHYEMRLYPTEPTGGDWKIFKISSKVRVAKE